MKRLILSLGVLLFLSGCLSTSKQAGEEAPSAFKGNKSGALSKEGGQLSIEEAKAMPTAGADKKEEIDTKSKYQSLSQALHNNNDTQIYNDSGLILSVQPEDPIALNAVALMYFRKNKPGAAKLLISRALEKNQGNASLWNNLGVALAMEGEEEAAIANWKKALQLDESHAQACANLGAIYVKGGDNIRALPLLEKAYRSLKNPAVANNYAVALRMAGKLEEAEGIYSDMIKANPKDVILHLNYAILLIDHLKKPKEGLPLVYRVKFLETERQDIINRANALEVKAKVEP